MTVKWLNGGAGGVRIGIDGHDALIRKLQKLKVPRNEQLKAMTPAARLIQNKAKSLVPVQSGALRRSIGLKRLRGEPAAIAVRPKYSKSISKKSGKVTSGYHAHLVEFGTLERVIPIRKRWKTTLGGKTIYVKRTGRMKPQPFMRPAFQQMADPAQRLLMANMWKLIRSKAQKRVA